MAEHTKIEWADATFNPWVGCTKVSHDDVLGLTKGKNIRVGKKRAGRLLDGVEHNGMPR